MKTLLPLLFIGLMSMNCHGQQSISKCNIIVIAHRGDHSSAPENTLKSYEDAIRNGANYIEVDLRTSSDRELVVMHDATVDRTTNGHGDLKSMTYIQLRALNIKEQTHSGAVAQRIPNFDEVLRLAKGRIKIYLDFKDADVNMTLQMLMKHQMEKDVVVYINENSQYAAWRTAAPKIPLIISLPDSVNDATSLDAFLNLTDAEILDGKVNDYNAAMIQIAHAMGRKIWLDVQSQNEGVNDWQQALDLGIDGLQTDHLGELRKWLSQQKP